MTAVNDLFALTKADLNKKTKDDIVRMVLAAKEAHAKLNDKCENDTQDALSALTQCTKALQKEIGDLKGQMESIQTMLPSDANLTISTIPHPDSNSEAMRKSLQSVLVDKKLISEMVISNVVEDGKDEEFLSNLCHRVGFKLVPKGCMRLGKKTDSGKRPLKVTFHTEFDARAFKAQSKMPTK